PAALRAWLRVNETITTLLLDYVALLIVDDLIYGPWKDPAGRGCPLSATFPAAARLPVLIPGTRVHLGLLRAPAAAAAVAVLLGGLFVGGDALQISLGLPIAVVYMLQGLIFFFVLGGEIIVGYRVVIRRRTPVRMSPEASR